MRYKLHFGATLRTDLTTREGAVQAAKEYLLGTGDSVAIFVDTETGFRYRVRQLGRGSLAVDGARVGGNQFSVTNLDSRNCGNSNSGNNC